MPNPSLAAQFAALKTRRRIDPAGTLAHLGTFSAAVLNWLFANAALHDVPWRGGGAKNYAVLVDGTSAKRWSRAVNRDLFVSDVRQFGADWTATTTALLGSAGKQVVSGASADLLNRTYYTATFAYAAAVDLFNPNRGGPGTFLEMLVGPTLSILTARTESGAIVLPVPDTDLVESVPVDMTFEPSKAGRGVGLVVPTKISTRERVSQPYVHQRILDAARPGRYRTVLCIGNENNAFHERGTPAAKRSAETLYLQDTLVPGTIALYQRYVAELGGMFYLDPPAAYLAAPKGLPPVSDFGGLLTEHLPELLVP